MKDFSYKFALTVLVLFVLTALVGAPVFLHLIWRTGRSAG